MNFRAEASEKSIAGNALRLDSGLCRFIAAGDDLWSARTALDLLAGGPWDGHAETGGGLDPLKLASELASALGAMAQSAEAVAVAKLMQSEVASGVVSRRILDAAGGVSRRL